MVAWHRRAQRLMARLALQRGLQRRNPLSSSLSCAICRGLGSKGSRKCGTYLRRAIYAIKKQQSLPPCLPSKLAQLAAPSAEALGYPQSTIDSSQYELPSPALVQSACADSINYASAQATQHHQTLTQPCKQCGRSFAFLWERHPAPSMN